MARPATGQVVERQGAHGVTRAIRFRAGGQRHQISLGAVSRAQAEVELANVLADVRRGIWQPPAPTPDPVELREVPTFHEFASAWFEARRVEGGRRGAGLTPAGEADLRWQLSNHLLPHFATRRLDAITTEDVDHFRRAKVAEGLSATSVNKFLRVLAAILELAQEYGHVERNSAKGRRRRLPSVTPRRTYIDRADHVRALLDAAAELDMERRSARFRRPLLAVLTLAALRIDEALSLRWRNVDLAAGAIRAPGTKTDAAERTVDMLPLLRDELVTWATTVRDREPDALVFGTSTGGKQSASNIRNRVLADAVERANVNLAAAGLPDLPAGLTPHSLRRTGASILVARGEDPAFVMAQLGHTSPNLTLALYAKAMQRRDGEKERLKALVDGENLGTDGHESPFGRMAEANAELA